MIEVFKTNVKDRTVASMLLDVIHNQFKCYKANFDLDDRDRILRVVSANGAVETHEIIEIIMNRGFYVEVLAD